jgi:hypothetical protein
MPRQLSCYLQGWPTTVAPATWGGGAVGTSH